LLPIAIWILRNYFITIPKEISGAAVIDGCSHIKVLIKIILPMVSPRLFATGIYVFLSAWSEFFFSLILTSTNAKTITVAITEFTTQGGIDYGMMTMAGIIGSIVPLILAIIFQKYLIKGLTAGWGK
jgi:multiple sugar transport system permease protein